MCGIVGYLGGRDATRIVLEGLKRLEYRGYDSAGLALLNDGEIELRRSPGKLTALERILERDPAQGTVGIGHTRWATHGKPSEENAHPLRHRPTPQPGEVGHGGVGATTVCCRSSAQHYKAYYLQGVDYTGSVVDSGSRTKALPISTPSNTATSLEVEIGGGVD